MKWDVGWGGLTLAKQGSWHQVELIFSVGNRDNSCLGSIWESQKSSRDGWCSAKEEIPKLLQRGQRPWAEQGAGGCSVPHGGTQQGWGGAARAGGASQERPRASRTAAGMGQQGRVGGHQRRAKLATQHWVEVMLKWKKTSRRMEMHPHTSSHSTLQQRGHSKHRKKNRNNNWGLNSEPQMPLSPTGHSHIMKTQVLLGREETL